MLIQNTINHIGFSNLADHRGNLGLPYQRIYPVSWIYCTCILVVSFSLEKDGSTTMKFVRAI